MRTRFAAALATLALVATPTTASAHQNEWNPCKHEDGSGQGRCVWDGRHMGNGEGRSYKVKRDDSVKYITHRWAHHLLNGRTD
jgi:hypothetical protein